MDIVISTVATVVRVMASMKWVYITAQHSADTHSAQPPLRISAHSRGPRSHSRAAASAAALKALRQKVTSKLRAPCRWRVTTPAVLHINVTSSISKTAREWLNRIGFGIEEGRKAARAIIKLEPPLGGGRGCPRLGRKAAREAA